jgi:hypothetical protein
MISSISIKNIGENIGSTAAVNLDISIDVATNTAILKLP